MNVLIGIKTFRQDVMSYTWNWKNAVENNKMWVFYHRIRWARSIQHLLLYKSACKGNLRLFSSIMGLSTYMSPYSTPVCDNVLSTSYIYACRYGHIILVRYLIGRGVSANCYQNCAITECAKNGHLDILKYITCFENVQTHNRNEEALREACKNGHYNIVVFLVEQFQADIHVENEECLLHATRNNYTDIVRYLVKKGANIHIYHDRPLRISSREGYFELVKFFVEEGGDVLIHKNQALHWSAFNGHHEIVQYLLEHGAEAFAFQSGPLRVSSANGHMSIVKLLVQYGAKIDDLHFCALRWSACHGHFHIVNFLLKKYYETHDRSGVYSQKSIQGMTRSTSF